MSINWILNKLFEALHFLFLSYQAQPYIFTNKNGDTVLNYRREARQGYGSHQNQGKQLFTHNADDNSPSVSHASTIVLVVGVAAVALIVATVVVIALRRKYRRHSYDNLAK
jgi:hypothetical protein